MSDVPTRVDESDRAASPANLTESVDSETLSLPGPRARRRQSTPEHGDEFIPTPISMEMHEDLQVFFKVYLAAGMHDRARAFRNGRYTVEEKEKRNAIDVKCMPGTLVPDDLDRSRMGPKEKFEEQKREKKKSQTRNEESTSPRPRLESNNRSFTASTCSKCGFLEAGAGHPEFHKQCCHCQQKLRTGDFDDRKRFRPGDRRPIFVCQDLYQLRM